MKSNKNFGSRLLDAMVASESDIKAVCGTLLKWDGRNGYQPQNNILRCAMNFKVLEGVSYTESDLRGLSKAEKEFMRDNGYKSYIDVLDIMGKKVRYYIFISINTASGKKQVYGQSKYQILDPNGQYFPISAGTFNYDKWLTLDTSKSECFSKYRYELRNCRNLCPIAINQ